jgi:hypothetical protein
LTALLAAAILVIAVAGVVLGLKYGTSPSSSSSAAAHPRTTGTASTMPSVRSVAGGSAARLAGGPTPPVTSSGASTGSVGQASPHIMGPPAGSTGVPEVLPTGSAPVSVPAAIDGCDRDYGTGAQCVPLALPPGVTDWCTWLRANGYLPLKVAGRDTLHLDPRGTGFACA